MSSYQSVNKQLIAGTFLRILSTADAMNLSLLAIDLMIFGFKNNFFCTKIALCKTFIFYI